jgi:Flp pilus assembly protein TadG
MTLLNLPWSCRRADDAAGDGGDRVSVVSTHNGLLGGLAQSELGATMVEFAIVALPFFILLLGAFDIGFYYWGSEELEHATAYGARLVRTGQVQNGGINQAQLKTEICSKTAVLVGCATRLRIDVRSGQSLADITPPSPLDGQGVLKSDADFVFSPGVGSDVVLVSAFFNWQLVLKPSDYIMRAAVVARNEPF